MRTVEEILAELKDATGEKRSQLLAELRALPVDKPSPRAQLEKLRGDRSGLVTELDGIVEAAAAESREFTVEEAEKRGGLTARIDQLDAAITEAEDQVRQAEHDEREKRMEEKLAERLQKLGLGDGMPLGPSGISGVKVGDEPRTYERGNGQSYLLDMCLARTALGQSLGARSVRAAERLARHAQENHVVALEIDERIRGKAQEEREKEWRTADGYFLKQMIEVHNQRDQDRGPIAERAMSYRALSTASTSGGEFTPPLFLTAEWIAYARPGRVLADLQHHEELPDGTMSINIPKVSEGLIVKTQGFQNTNVANKDMQTQFVTFPVTTKAGSQVISLQLLERSPVSFDEIVGRELALAYAQDLNTSVHSGTGVTSEGGPDMVGILNTSGINIITWTQALPTLKGLYGQIGRGKMEVAKGRKLPATDQVLTTELWEWVGQTFDTQNRPLVVPGYQGPFNAAAVSSDDAIAQGTVGRQFQQLGTFEDQTLPTELGTGKNQDVLLGGRFDENYLYESPLTTRMLPQTLGTQLSMLIQVYGYAAFTAARYPVANFVVTGTGMSSANRTFNS